MHGPCRNVAAVAHPIRRRFAAHRERHLSIQNDVRCKARVRVVGIVRVRAILPDVRLRESFGLELLAKLAIVRSGHDGRQL